MAWIINNLGTIVVLAVLVAVCIWIVIIMRRDKKAGKCCGCSGCKGCSLCGTCADFQNADSSNQSAAK